MAKAVAHVLDEGFNDVRAADLAAFFFHRVESSEFQPRLAPRFFPSRAPGNEVGDPLLEMKSQLGVETLFGKISLERPLMSAHESALSFRM